MPGERLVRVGDPAREVFFISSGKVDVVIGRRRVTLGPGDFFGEMGLLTRAPRSADVIAIDYCQLLTLDHDDFQGFIAKYPALKDKIGRIASARETENRQQRNETPDKEFTMGAIRGPSRAIEASRGPGGRLDGRR